MHGKRPGTSSTSPWPRLGPHWLLPCRCRPSTSARPQAAQRRRCWSSRPALLPGLRPAARVRPRTAGYALTGIAGLSAGVDPVAGPLLWPPLAGLAIWSLRKGARWPLLAPLCFVAVWGSSVLASVAASSAPPSLATLVSGMGQLGMHGGREFWATADRAGRRGRGGGHALGRRGGGRARPRAAVLTAWLTLTILMSLLFAHSAVRAEICLGTHARGAALGHCGDLRVCLRRTPARLGQAGAGAPACDPGHRRHAGALTRARQLSRLGARHLAHALLDRALLRAEVRAWSAQEAAEMDGLFDLARAQGLRPDLEIGHCSGKSR
jgi:hypothetical protein